MWDETSHQGAATLHRALNNCQMSAHLAERGKSGWGAKFNNAKKLATKEQVNLTLPKGKGLGWGPVAAGTNMLLQQGDGQHPDSLP